MFYIYILQSLKDKNFYVGLTSNLTDRLDYHNSGRVKSTKSRKPFKLVYFEEFKDRSEAREREKFLKSYKGSKQKFEILESLKLR